MLGAMHKDSRPNPSLSKAPHPGDYQVNCPPAMAQRRTLGAPRAADGRRRPMRGLPAPIRRTTATWDCQPTLAQLAVRDEESVKRPSTSYFPLKNVLQGGG
jgi:hypothetical protein